MGAGEGENPPSPAPHPLAEEEQNVSGMCPVQNVRDAPDRTASEAKFPEPSGSRIRLNSVYRINLPNRMTALPYEDNQHDHNHEL